MTPVPAPWVTDLLDQRVLIVAASGNLGWSSGGLELVLDYGETVHRIAHDGGRFAVTELQRDRPFERFSTDNVRAVVNHLLDAAELPFPEAATGQERDRIRVERLHRGVAMYHLTPAAEIAEVDGRLRVDWPDGTTAIVRSRHDARWTAHLGAMTPERFLAEKAELDLDEITRGHALEWEPSSQPERWWAKRTARPSPAA